MGAKGELVAADLRPLQPQTQPSTSPLSRQLGKEKGIKMTILLTTNNKGGFIFQRLEPKLSSPDCLSMQYLIIIRLDGWELEHVMCVRRGWGKWKSLCVAWKRAGWEGELLAVFYLLKGKDGGAWSRGNSHRWQQEKTLLGYKEKSVYNGLAVEHITQKGCVISIPEDLHASLGRGPEQPDINFEGGLALSRWLDLFTSRSSSQN